MMLDKTEFGRRVKIACWHKGMDRRSAAEIIGVTYDVMGCYERGGSIPGVATLIRMREVFGRSIDWLLGLEGES